MKSICLACVMLLGVTLPTWAQETVKSRKGFIGIALGPSIPLGTYQKDADLGVGLNISLVNFGYLFSKHFGITARWSGAAHAIDIESSQMMSAGNLMIGLLFSRPINEKLHIDLKGMLGYGTSIYMVDNATVEAQNGLAQSLGVGMRYNFARRWALTANLDYVKTNIEKRRGMNAIQGNLTDPSFLDLSAGVAFRL